MQSAGQKNRRGLAAQFEDSSHQAVNQLDVIDRTERRVPCRVRAEDILDFAAMIGGMPGKASATLAKRDVVRFGIEHGNPPNVFHRNRGFKLLKQAGNPQRYEVTVPSDAK